MKTSFTNRPAPDTRASALLPSDSLQGLLSTIRHDAAVFRRYGDERMAGVCEQFAEWVEEIVRLGEQEILTLHQAAEESGYSEDHLGRMVRERKIPNAGRRNAPRILRRDLPIKPGHLPNRGRHLQLLGASQEQIARAVANSDVGGRDG